MYAGPRPTIWRSALRWWGAAATHNGHIAASGQLLKALAELARDSTPQRRRQLYGDVDFDWDYHVNNDQRRGRLARSAARHFQLSLPAD